MALPKQSLPINFNQGIQTKVDENSQPIGTFRRLENVIFETINKFRKRNGYTSLILRDSENSTITNGKAIDSFLRELCLFTSSNFYTYSPTIKRWFAKGEIINAFPTTEPILRNNLSQSALDMVSNNELDAFTFVDSEGVKLSVRDRDSDNVLASNVLISANGTNPRLANINNQIFCFYRISATLRYKIVNLLDPENVGAEVVLKSDLDGTNPNYDAIGVADKIAIAYNSNDSADKLTTFTIDSGETASSSIVFAGEIANGHVSLAADSLNRLLVSYYDGSDVKFAVVATNLTNTFLSPTLIETVSNVEHVVALEENVGNYVVLYDIDATLNADTLIRKNTITLAGTVGTATVAARSLSLASKLFTYNSRVYGLALHESTFQATYFVIRSDGKIISRLLAGVAGEQVAGNTLPDATIINASEIAVPVQAKGRTITDDGTFYSALGVNATYIQFDDSDPYQSDRLGPNLHISAGYLHLYDGNTLSEHGFHLFPENLSLNASTTTGGSIADGVYQYAAVYAWTDNKGQIHRSAPSIPLSVTLSGGTTTQTAQIRVPTLRLTEKENVIIEVYRTENVGDVFYKVTSTVPATLNDSTIDFIDFTDTQSDTDLIDNEILYTTGGVLDNIAAPSSKIIESAKDRIFLGGLEDENKLAYSKIRFENAPVEFNDALTININPGGGKITAIKSMDDKIIVFKERSIFYFVGDGPNNLGEQNNFTEPDLISSDVGCVDTNSVVFTPNGLMFKSQKGIYILTRSLQTQYIGAAVEEFNGSKVTSAELIPENNQVRFLTDTEQCLVYDYLVNQWVTFSNHQGLSATNLRGIYYYLRASNLIFVEDRTTFSDDGTPIKIKLQTGWLSFGGIQGFKRIYKMLMLGNYKSPHKIRVKAAYDFVNAFVQETTIDTADFTSDVRYGEDSPYGTPEATPYGGAGNQYQFKVGFKRQKCESIKIEIEEIQTDKFGEGLELSNMAFEVGIKSGTNKLPDGRGYGTK